MAQPLIADIHLDLAMNALEWNRDLRWTVPDIRESEHGLSDRPDRGRGTVSFGEMRRGNVGLCVATLIGRYVRRGSPIPGWHSQEQAWAQTQGQRAWYRAMEESGELTPITSAAELDRHLAGWQAGGGTGPIGYVLSLEGADSFVTVGHLERAYADGLRAVGPAHYGPGVYANGTTASGGLNERGRELLREMDRLGVILDATHLCDEAFWESLDLFHGPVWASHNNCRALVPHQRQFSDAQIRAIIERDGVIGAAFDAWMLQPGWVVGQTSNESVTLAKVVDHIDHVCQLAGNSRHAGLGTDLDGGYGREQSPCDLDTIADLQKIGDLLAGRGYGPGDVEAILFGNWVRLLRRSWSR